VGVYHIKVKHGRLSSDKNVLAIEFYNCRIKISKAYSVSRLMAGIAYIIESIPDMLR